MLIHVHQRWLKLLLAGFFLFLSSCGNNDPQSPVQPAAGPLVTVYKSPTCSCCQLWVDHLQASGFTTQVEVRENVMPIKQQLGVPPGMGSCHTAEVDGYVIEGHVPAEDIHRLLKERPQAKGLAVPGMPIGSPGMEHGDRRDPYQVLMFTERDGTAEVFAKHNQQADTAP